MSVSGLRLDTLRMPSADLGPENPLPPLFGPGDVHDTVTGEGVDDDMRRGLAYGRVPSVLPYLMQDGYGRERAEAEHPVAVLENEHLRATFLIGLGGRLWSLIDKRSGRELLHVNRVFQPANLALRNAWFAGGVEWNLGTTGHWPLTCAALHVARVERSDGEPALRMYEYERLRGLVVRIDASLASDAALLVVRITIENPNPVETPVYWWSNIAVPEREDVRVLTPATGAWHFGYQGILSKVPFPHHEGLDRSYTTRARDAADYFFDLANAEPPWIAALDGDGRGLVQASSPRLRGRKLFLWGTGPGSRHWQRWLGDADTRYLEIQAGLARTQLEHLPLPAGESWSWVEVYGPGEADARGVHGDRWPQAVDAAERAVHATGAAEVIARETARDAAQDHIVEPLARASGWGALEDARRSVVGEPPLSSEAAPFFASDLGIQQERWLDLPTMTAAGRPAQSTPQRAGEWAPDVGAAPPSYQADAAWLPLLALRDTWDSHLYAGVIHAVRDDVKAAEREWRASLERAENGWAWRNLARMHAHVAGLHAHDARTRDACAHERDPGALEPDAAAVAAAEYEGASRMLPGVVQLAVEHAGFLIATGSFARALAFIDALPVDQRRHGRIRFAEARAALETGDLQRCAALLEAGIEIADLKEGEVSLDALWTDFHERRLAAEARTATETSEEIRARVASEFPPPERYDFRMHV